LDQVLAGAAVGEEAPLRARVEEEEEEEAPEEVSFGSQRKRSYKIQTIQVQ
jgi:hypothetical protein